MAAVTFPIAQGGDGLTYDEADMLNYGYVTRFFPILGQTVIMAQSAAGSAVASAAGAAALTAVSATSATIGAGSKSFTASTGKSFVAGQMVAVVRTSAPTASQMFGAVTSYNVSTGALVVSVTDTLGSGTFTDWTIAPAGMRGVAGSGNSMTRLSVTAAGTTLGASDNGKFVDCSGATAYTLALIGAASLGAGWWCIVRASGTALITIDPASAETIDGAATLDLYPGNGVLIQCDGTTLRTVGMPRRVNSLPILSAAALSATAMTPLGTVENSKHATGLSGTGAVVTQNGTLFVVSRATASDGNVASSADGQTWTLRAMPSSLSWCALAVGTGFMAWAVNGTATAYSAAGTSWASATALPGATPAQTGNMGAGISGVFLVRGAASNTTVYKTVNNGSSWTPETLPAANLTLASCGGLLVAWGSGNTYYTSTTGATSSWTARAFPGSRQTAILDYDGALLCLQATDLTVTVQRSTDGTTWTDLGVTSASATYFNRVGGGYVSSNGTSYVTLHGGAWVERDAANLAGGGGFAKNVAKMGNVHICTAPSSAVALVDATSATVKKSLFLG